MDPRNLLPFPRGSTASGASPALSNKQGQLLAEAIKGQSIQGQVLIAAAFVEKSISGCLCAYLRSLGVNHDDRKTLLDGPNSLLGSFWAGTIGCRVAGIIQQPEQAATDAVRAIRNRFAHADLQVDLSDAKAQKHMPTLRTWMENLGLLEDADLPYWKNLMASTGNAVNTPLLDKDVFLGAAITLQLAYLNAQWECNAASPSMQSP